MLRWEKKITVWENNSTRPGTVTYTNTHTDTQTHRHTHTLYLFIVIYSLDYKTKNVTFPHSKSEELWFTSSCSHTFSLVAFRWGQWAWSVAASQLRCRVCSCSQGFLPQHDLSQGSAAAPAQTQAQCMYLCLSAALVSVYYSQTLLIQKTDIPVKSQSDYRGLTTVSEDSIHLNQRFFIRCIIFFLTAQLGAFRGILLLLDDISLAVWYNYDIEYVFVVYV